MGKFTTAIARTALVRLGPSTAVIARASRMLGKAKMTSITRMISVSARPAA